MRCASGAAACLDAGDSSLLFFVPSHHRPGHAFPRRSDASRAGRDAPGHVHDAGTCTCTCVLPLATRTCLSCPTCSAAQPLWDAAPALAPLRTLLPPPPDLLTVRPDSEARREKLSASNMTRRHGPPIAQESFQSMRRLQTQKGALQRPAPLPAMRPLGAALHLLAL